MKLSKLYNLFPSTCVRPRSSSDGDRKGQKRARCKSNSSLPCEVAHKTCYRSTAAAARVHSTLQKSAEQRSQKVPSNAAALNNLKIAASVPYTVKSIPLNRFEYGICFNCLFSFYCDDKDKVFCPLIFNFMEFWSLKFRYRVIRFSYSDMSITHSRYFRSIVSARMYVNTLLSLGCCGSKYGIFILTH